MGEMSERNIRLGVVWGHFPGGGYFFTKLETEYGRISRKSCPMWVSISPCRITLSAAVVTWATLVKTHTDRQTN